jgi:hypothetical protein
MFSRPLIQCVPNLILTIVRPVELSGPKGIDQVFTWVKTHAHIKEIEVEHCLKGVEEGLKDSTRFTATPDGWEGEDTHQIVHAMLQALDFGCRIHW